MSHLFCLIHTFLCRILANLVLLHQEVAPIFEWEKLCWDKVNMDRVWMWMWYAALQLALPGPKTIKAAFMVSLLVLQLLNCRKISRQMIIFKETSLLRGTISKFSWYLSRWTHFHSNLCCCGIAWRSKMKQNFLCNLNA